MSDISKTIDGIVGAGLAPALKKDGYKKKGRNFLLTSMDVIRVVNVQASQWNIGSSGQFTLNLGIYLPKIANFIGNEISGEFPKEYECTVRERIGSLMPKGEDYWWELEKKTDTETLALEVVEAWTKFGRPWMDQAWDRADFLKEFLQKDLNYEAAIALHVLEKDMEGAKVVLKKAIDEYRRDGHENGEKWILEWAGKYKLRLE
jgi:hypothetical protein